MALFTPKVNILQANQSKQDRKEFKYGSGSLYSVLRF